MRNKDYPWVKEYLISGLHYYQNYDFKFEERKTIMVGESGLGKTKILHLLYLTLTCRWIALSKQQFDFISITFSNGNDFNFSKGELEFFVLSSGSETELITKNEKKRVKNLFEQIEKIIKTCIPGKVIYFPVYRNLIDDFGLIGKDYEQTHFSSEFGITEFVEASAIEKDILIPTTLSSIFTNASFGTSVKLQTVVDTCNIYLQGIILKLTTKNIVKIINKFTEEVVDLDQLSAGEKQLIYFFFKCACSNKKGTYILFDEPELSLPMEWQRRLLNDLASVTKCHFMLAITHSPFIFDNEFDQFTSGINTYKFHAT